MLTLTFATVLTVANAKLSVYVLPLTVLNTTLSYNVLVLTVANAKLSVYVLSLTVLTATLSFNMLPRY